jgi:type IV secretion system protein VirB4
LTTDVIDNTEVRVPHQPLCIDWNHSSTAVAHLRTDEFWKILDGGGALKEFARTSKDDPKAEWLGIFATQSPEDALASDISAALIE